MKATFDQLSAEFSRITTRTYSTSFTLGTKLLHPRLRPGVYAIYGFVRFADEIVDSFHGHDRRQLLLDFRQATLAAIEQRVSLNPILNSFQDALHRYKIDLDLIDSFLYSMEMDLTDRNFNYSSYYTYVHGSAEVVGLMCLRVFTEGNAEQYETLKPFAKKLGAAFQKVNFLRDLNADYHELGRNYFPGTSGSHLNQEQLAEILNEIQADFDTAVIGIRKLPRSSRKGVYVAYRYYRKLMDKLRRKYQRSATLERVRISNSRKVRIMVGSLVRHQLNLI